VLKAESIYFPALLPIEINSDVAAFQGSFCCANFKQTDQMPQSLPVFNHPSPLQIDFSKNIVFVTFSDL
jgi:hypothetical protein